MQRLLQALALGSVALAPLAPAALLVENFDGDTNATVDLTLTSNDEENAFSPIDTIHTVANDKYNVVLNGADTSSAYTDDAGGPDFQVSAYFSPNSVNFTSSNFGLFARSAFPDYDEGIYLSIVNDGFSSGAFKMQILNVGNVIAETAVFDLTSVNNAASFDLVLTGIEQGNGDLDVTATFTPDPNDNPLSLSPMALNATVLAVNIPVGSRYGIRADGFSNNTLDVDVDDLSVFVGTIPTPAPAGIVGVGSVLIASRRRRA